MWTVRPGAPQGSTLPRESSLLPSSRSIISRFSLISFSVKHLTPILHCAWNPWVQTLSLNFPQNTLLSPATLGKKKLAWLLPLRGGHVAWAFADPQSFKQSLLFQFSCPHFYNVLQIPEPYWNSVRESFLKKLYTTNSPASLPGRTQQLSPPYSATPRNFIGP